MTATLDETIRLLRTEDPFLRRRLGYGAFVGSRFPYLYVETPKAACTTTKMHLWRLEQLGPVPYLSRVHERPPGDPRLSLLSVSEDRAIEAMRGPGVFRFFVWRDPIRRLVSAYQEKIRLAADPGLEWPQWRALIVRTFGLTSEKEITLDHFASFVCRVPDEQRDTHFMSQRRLLLVDFVRYHRVVRVETYADDMADVYRSIGAPESEWPPLDIHESASGSEELQISEATAAMVRAAFQADYELLQQPVAAFAPPR